MTKIKINVVVREEKMNEIKTIDNLLVYGLREKLSNTQMKRLYENGNNPKNILIYDYLLDGNKSNNFDSGNSILEGIISKKHTKVDSRKNKDFKFITPEKDIILEGYKKYLFIVNFDDFEKLETKEELKKLYCFDEVYSRLNENRKEKIDSYIKGDEKSSFKDLSELLNYSSEFYKNQKKAGELNNQIERIEEKIKKNNYDAITFDKLEQAEEIRNELEKISKESSSDFEVSKEINRAKEDYEWLKETIKSGIELRKTEELEGHKDYLDDMDKKPLLSEPDIKDIREKKIALSDLMNILDYVQESGKYNISSLSKKCSSLLDKHEFFVNNKISLDKAMKKQEKLNKRLNKKISKIDTNKKPSLFVLWRMNNTYNRSQKMEDNFKRISSMLKNRYLNTYFNEKEISLIKETENLKKRCKPIKDYYKKHLINYYEGEREKFLIFGFQEEK